VRLATREDWQEVLAAAATLGTTTVWVAFHGLGVEHDRQVNSSGAYAEMGLAIQRIHAAGLRAGCNVFLTTTNVGQTERLLGAAAVRGRRDVVGAGDLLPNGTGRRNERLQPELPDLRPLATRIPQVSLFDHDIWANLEAHARGGLGASRADRRLANVDAPGQ
jgi:MoaA/NifB/PqqE/SkfB family radical SAM enzyme